MRLYNRIAHLPGGHILRHPCMSLDGTHQGSGLATTNIDARNCSGRRVLPRALSDHACISRTCSPKT
eukprot:830896-Pyramimonas_sp.AAC.1